MGSPVLFVIGNPYKNHKTRNPIPPIIQRNAFIMVPLSEFVRQNAAHFPK